MRTLSVIFTLFLLLNVTTYAQEWQLLEPPMPVEGFPGEEFEVRLSGPADADVRLHLDSLIDLVESAPGEYRALVAIPGKGSTTLRLSTAQGDIALGEVGVAERGQFFVAGAETPTRQGPDIDLDRRTPLLPGATVAIDGRRGHWYRSVGSGNWFSGKTGERRSGALSPNRLQRILIEDAPNGDALVRLQGLRAPEVQVTESMASSSLVLRLEDTQASLYDLTRPSGVAPFLGPIDIRPGTHPRRVELELPLQEISGFHLEPGQTEGEVVVRLRRPLPRQLKDLIITLDPGHGGPETGTVGHGGLAEKTINLRVGKALARLLEERGATVVMTRTTDSNVADDPADLAAELQARVDRSIEAGSHLFMSLHHNAKTDPEEGKITHRTDIYWFHPHSQALARFMADPVAKAVGEPDRTSRWRSFHVTRQTHSPAILIEFQYLSNPILERDVLDQPGYPERAARGVVEGLENYLNSLK